MPTKLVRKMRNFQGMAEVSLLNKDVKMGLSYMREAVECAVKHDELPEVVYANDILFNQHPYDRKCEATMHICAELKKDFETEDEFYEGVRTTKEYQEMIGMLEKQ